MAAQPIKLAFAVDSIEILRPLAAELGGVIDPATAQWEFRGGIHCDGADPEGNVIQLVQPVRIFSGGVVGLEESDEGSHV